MTAGTEKTGGPGDSLLLVHLLMLISATLVSTSFTVGAAITRFLDPVLLTFVRFCLAAALFAPFIKKRYGLSCTVSLLLRCGLISLSLVVFFCCMFYALRFTTAINTSILFALVPAISWAYARLMLGERLSGSRMTALCCGMVGAVWVIFRGDPGRLVSLEWNRGDLIFLLGCLSMGLYTPLVKLLHRGEPMAVMTFWVLVTGGLWLLVPGLVLMNGTELASIPLEAWLGVGYLAIFTTIITFFLTQYSVPYLGATRVMAYSYLYPALVLLIELALGHGLPPMRTLPGVVIVLVAMFVLQGAASHEEKGGFSRRL